MRAHTGQVCGRTSTAFHHPYDEPERADDDGSDRGGGGGTAAAPEEYSLPLDRGGGSGAARVFTRRCLNRWGLDDRAPAGEDAVLVVSELVTNAHLHADVAEALRLRWQPPTLVIEVQDRGSSGMPRVCPPTADRVGGRGLTIVSQLARRCQIVLGTLGRKTVRVEMLLQSA